MLYLANQTFVQGGTQSVFFLFIRSHCMESRTKQRPNTVVYKLLHFIKVNTILLQNYTLKKIYVSNDNNQNSCTLSHTSFLFDITICQRLLIPPVCNCLEVGLLCFLFGNSANECEQYYILKPILIGVNTKACLHFLGAFGEDHEVILVHNGTNVAKLLVDALK